MDSAKKIIKRTRRLGNTNWVLKSAIDNNVCVIVSKTIAHSKNLKSRYDKMIVNERKSLNREFPKFLTISDRFEYYGVPVIFDYGVFL